VCGYGDDDDVKAGRGVHARAAPSCAVGVDCCTFDRVLLFLEAHAMGRPFDVLPEHLDGMAQVYELELNRIIARIIVCSASLLCTPRL